MVGYVTKDERVADPMKAILAETILLAKLLVKSESIDVWRNTPMKGGVEVRDRLCIGKLFHCGANQSDGGCIVPISTGQLNLWSRNSVLTTEPGRSNSRGGVTLRQ